MNLYVVKVHVGIVFIFRVNNVLKFFIDILFMVCPKNIKYNVMHGLSEKKNELLGDNV